MAVRESKQPTKRANEHQQAKGDQKGIYRIASLRV